MGARRKPSTKGLVWCPGGDKSAEDLPRTKRGYLRCPTCNRRLLASVQDCEQFDRRHNSSIREMVCAHYKVPPHKALLARKETT